MTDDIYRYYVYAYLRSNGTPYYIGKGCNKRAYKKHQHIPVPKEKSRIVFLETNLSNVGALAMERRYICWYGRKDLGTGILINMTDGGEGVEGHVHSAETRARLSTIGKGRTSPNKGKPGKPHTEHTKLRLSLSLKGRKKSEIHKTKISASLKERSRLGIPTKSYKSYKRYKRKYKQIWITDGKINTRIKFDCVIPHGFRRGCTNKLDGEVGFEPTFAESKAAVLPLDDSPNKY